MRNGAARPMYHSPRPHRRPPLRFLIIGTETHQQREERRRTAGSSSAESFQMTLEDLFPQSRCETHSCVDDEEAPEAVDPSRFDVVFFAGSPIAMHEDTPVTRRARRFMARVFESGIPSFGSCAGLQVATVAAGGTVKPSGPDLEAAFARRIVATEAGRDHPLLAGRPASFEAPAMHSDEVDRLPEGATLLAVNGGGRVQAVEIRFGKGTFWGVQYHPELSLAEIAVSVRRQESSLLEFGFAADEDAVERYARRIEALGHDPSRKDLRWELGVTQDITDPPRRRREIVNFVQHFVAHDEAVRDVRDGVPA